MADRLTQLQDCLDDLLTQMYASITYIQTRAPYGDIPGQPRAPQAEPSQTASALASAVAAPTSAISLTNGEAASAKAAEASRADMQQSQPQREGQQAPPTPAPEEQSVFDAALRELAQDLVLQEQQIEHLINSLPGIGNIEADQERRMRELEQDLREVERERARAEEERERMVEGLGRVIVGAKRIP